jgi:hypothetical protein
MTNKSPSLIRRESARDASATKSYFLLNLFERSTASAASFIAQPTCAGQDHPCRVGEDNTPSRNVVCD